MDLIRDILLNLESCKNTDLNTDWSEDELTRYNMALIIQAGLAEGAIDDGVSNTSQAPSSVILRKLTWEGHEFLDNVRKDSVWSTIKVNFKNESLSTIMAVGK